MNCVKDVYALRLKNPALVAENLRFVHEDPENTVLGWVRWSDEGGAGNVYLCVTHLGDNEWAGKEYAIYTGWGADQRWIQVFNSQAESYGGWAESGTFADLVSDREGKILFNLPKMATIDIHASIIDSDQAISGSTIVLLTTISAREMIPGRVMKPFFVINYNLVVIYSYYFSAFLLILGSRLLTLKSKSYQLFSDLMATAELPKSSKPYAEHLIDFDIPIYNSQE